MVSNIFYFHPYLGKWSNLTNIFQRGWTTNYFIYVHIYIYIYIIFTHACITSTVNTSKFTDQSVGWSPWSHPTTIGAIFEASSRKKPQLGGGFKYLLCLSLFGEDEPFWMGWNYQLVKFKIVLDTPWKINGWNLQPSPISKGKWSSKSPWICSMSIFRGVPPAKSGHVFWKEIINYTSTAFIFQQNPWLFLPTYPFLFISRNGVTVSLIGGRYQVLGGRWYTYPHSSNHKSQP